MLHNLEKYKSVRTFIIFLLCGEYKNSLPIIHNIDDILNFIQNNHSIVDTIERLSNKGELNHVCLLEELRIDTVFLDAMNINGILKK